MKVLSMAYSNASTNVMSFYPHCVAVVPLSAKGICSQIFPCDEIVKGLASCSTPIDKSSALGADPQACDVLGS